MKNTDPFKMMMTFPDSFRRKTRIEYCPAAESWRVYCHGIPYFFKSPQECLAYCCGRRLLKHYQYNIVLDAILERAEKAREGVLE